MNKTLILATLTLISAPWCWASPNESVARVFELSMEDQFGNIQNLKDHRGKVVIIVYGDRQGIESSRKLGEKLHVLFHPQAAGQPPAKAKLAPVVPLSNIPQGMTSPDVVVIPVACIGNVPNAVKSLIKGQMKRQVAETSVWLDFSSIMEKQFKAKEGEPNLVIFDALGRLRFKVNGMPDKSTMQKILQSTQNLRSEAIQTK